MQTISSTTTARNDAAHGTGANWLIAGLRAIYVTECHYCGFRTADPPPVCPKCHGSSWDRFPRPGSLLERAENAAARGRVRRATSIERSFVK